MSEIVVIGGGASGLVSAIFAARGNNQVTILEHKDKIAKKILATGNGKCNYTNLNQKPEFYRGNDDSFAKKVLSGFDVNHTLKFFKELGIYPKEKNGYIYPNSEQASSVADVLGLELRRLRVRIYLNVDVQGIKKRNNKYCIFTNQDEYYADQVIIAAGGCASPNLGSDGSGYKLAKALGHKIIKPLPALIQLRSDAGYFKTLAGVRTEAKVRLYINGEFREEERGELLLAAYGVSGIPILQLSRYASRALDEKKKVHIIIDYLPAMKSDEILYLLLERMKRYPERTMEEILLGLLNNKLAYIGLKEAGFDPAAVCRSTGKNKLNTLVKQLKEWKVIITDTNSFEQAQVTAGGIDTKELNSKTLESNLSKGIYFAGEIIDIDGTCGGYNLQWAWSTGAIAGRNCGKNDKIEA